MKILLFGLNGRGGMLHYTSQYANALSKYHEVSVLLPTYSDTSLFNDTVRLIRIDAPPSIFGTGLNTIKIWNHIAILKKIRELNPEVIHVMDNHPWYVFYLSRLKKYRVFVTQHDPKLHSGEKESLTGRIVDYVNEKLRDRAERIIVHGENLKKILIELGVKPDSIIAVPIGSFGFFFKFGRKVTTEPCTILFFGRIVKYKGIDTLLKSIPLIIKDVPSLNVIIAGEGDFTPYSNFLTSDVKPYVTIVNKYISDDETAELFRRCSFVVLPYDDATQSGIIPIAYSFKKPVIASRVGSIPEVVDDGVTGFLVTPKDHVQLAKLIIKMMHSDVELMGENGFKKMNEIMDWDVIVKKINESYKEV